MCMIPSGDPRLALIPAAAPRAQLRMFTAREMTTATVSNDASDCTIISTFAQAVSGIVSVGLKAVALVNEVYR